METEQTISQIVAEVAAALKDAASEYGPQAAELALLAYRVDAAKTLLFVPMAAVGIFAVWRTWRWFWAFSAGWAGEDDWDQFPRAFPRALATICAAVATVLAVIESAARLIDIPVWLAAFGQPELLIATRALQAAGLM